VASSSTQEVTMTDRLAFAAALSVLLAAGCGRISDPVPVAQGETMAAPSFYEPSSTRIGPAAQDGQVFEYH
jgi:hypothetical protein